MTPDEKADFDRFLYFLDPDRDRAGERYEFLRQSLLRFFSANRSTDPETRADEVLDVLKRKVAAGEAIQKIESYAIGVARNVLLKELEKRNRTENPLEESDRNPLLSIRPPQEAIDKRLAEEVERGCFRVCLQSLPDGDRKLLSQYHGLTEDEVNRAELAAQHRISDVALRVRAHRIREAIKGCIQECLKKRQSSM